MDCQFLEQFLWFYPDRSDKSSLNLEDFYFY